MTPVDNSIIRKIQKLLSLASEKANGNEAEASLAMARAQELLAKHNLDFAMVQDTFVEGGTLARPEEKRERVRINRSAKLQWQRDLWTALAEANFCWYWVTAVHDPDRWHGKGTKTRVKRHMLLGRESNVISVRVMGEYLEDTIERILPYPNAERHSRAAYSWKSGCAERLVERIREKAEALKAESSVNASGSTGLVLRDVFQREYQGNYDAKWGTGAFARKQLQDAEWEAGQEAREARAEAQRVEAERKWLEYLQNETPQQKKERERAEAKERRRSERANEAYWNRRDRVDHTARRKESQRYDKEAYRSGSRAGESISLGQQVKDNSERRLG